MVSPPPARRVAGMAPPPQLAARRLQRGAQRVGRQARAPARSARQPVESIASTPVARGRPRDPASASGADGVSLDPRVCAGRASPRVPRPAHTENRTRAGVSWGGSTPPFVFQIQNPTYLCPIGARASFAPRTVPRTWRLCVGISLGTSSAAALAALAAWWCRASGDIPLPRFEADHHPQPTGAAPP